MILHFIPDEKFSDYAINHFAAEDMQSEFVLVCDTGIKYVSRLDKVRIVNPASDEFQKVLNQLPKYKAVVLHGLFWDWEERVISALPKDVKLGWAFWGAELYGRGSVKGLFLSTKSKHLRNRRTLIRTLKHFGRYKSNYQVPLEYFKRVDYCLTDVDEEFQWARNFLGTPIKQLWFNYYSIEETLGTLISDKCSGNDILVGNSCSLEANHLDVFSALKRIQIEEEQKIIVPLSYGEPWLRQYLIKKGKSMLTNFYPLTDFLPREEYNRIVRNCSTVLFNHYRPNGQGNIITAMWLGAKVFVSKRSMLYTFFNRIGCHIYSFEDDFSEDSLKKPMTSVDVEENKTILMSIYGKAAMAERMCHIVQVLNG